MVSEEGEKENRVKENEHLAAGTNRVARKWQKRQGTNCFAWNTFEVLVGSVYGRKRHAKNSIQ
jgi:hypothetical protein